MACYDIGFIVLDICIISVSSLNDINDSSCISRYSMIPGIMSFLKNPVQFALTYYCGSVNISVIVFK